MNINRYNKRLENNTYGKCIATLRSKNKNMHLANAFIGWKRY